MGFAMIVVYYSYERKIWRSILRCKAPFLLRLKMYLWVIILFNAFTSTPKCMPGSRDPGVTIVNPTEISFMFGYVHWPRTIEILSIFLALTNDDAYLWRSWILNWWSDNLCKIVDPFNDCVYPHENYILSSPILQGFFLDRLAWGLIFKKSYNYCTFMKW